MKPATAVLAFLLAAAPVAADELRTFHNAEYVPHESNDGDSFRVRADGEVYIIRLYFVDCPETKAGSDSDLQRIREQSRYFGLDSVKKTVEFGDKAAEFTREQLSQPFTLFTSLATAPGRSSQARVYAFVLTNNGSDLGRLLVASGLARAHGTGRETPGGVSRDETKARLSDLESSAMLAHTGIWAESNPERIVELRAEQRKEERELQEIKTQLESEASADRKIDINKASKAELALVHGIGPATADRIIAARPYTDTEELLRVKGIGKTKLESIRQYVTTGN